MIPLKYLSNFWRKTEISLINCKICLQSKWSKNCVLLASTAANQNLEFRITETSLYFPFVTLWTQDNIKLLKQLESGFKRTINWNKYLSKTKNQARNRYLGFLIDSSFQGVNVFFVLSFKDNDGRESHRQYYLPTAEMKSYNIMIDGILYYKLIAIDLSKQQKLDADPKAMQQINFIGNLDRAEGVTMFFIIEEAKETVLDFSKETVKVLWFYFVLTEY